MNELALLFPGVGSQYVGMGKELYDAFPIMRETFTEASAVLGRDMAALCFDSSKAELDQLENAQSSILTLSTAIYRVFEQEIGMEAQFFLGYSLGEYSALVTAGYLRFEDALKIIKERAHIILDVSTRLNGMMAWVINLEHEKTAEVCATFSTAENPLQVSAIDAPKQSSISGEKELLLKAGRALEQAGAIVFPLALNGPYHCGMMQEAADNMHAVLQKYTFSPSDKRVVSNRDALPYTTPEQIRRQLSGQLASPIRWQASIQQIVSQGVLSAVEIGPKTVLKFLVDKNTDQIRSFSLEKPVQIQGVKAYLNEKYRSLEIIGRCLKVAISTPNKNENSEEYAENVVKPYRQIQSLYQDLETKGEQPASSQVSHALGHLKTILKTKKVPFPEIQQRIKEVFQD